MTLVWGIVIGLTVVLIATQIAYARSIAGASGARAAVVIRVVNAVLLLVAIGLAAYATWLTFSGGGS